MSKRTEVCLVRHGETDWNRTGRYQGTSDIPLNDLGLEQARLGGIRLAGEHWDAIVSSPLSRAATTAQAIADAAGIEDIELLPDLMERGYGEAEGLTIAEREERWPDGVWPNLESVENTFARGRSALTHIAKTYPGKRVVAVSHGGLINAILHVVSEGELGTGISHIINVSFTRISSDDGETWSVETVSETDHLLDEEGVLQAMTPVAGARPALAAAQTGND